jgi:hypothetical protein
MEGEGRIEAGCSRKLSNLGFRVSRISLIRFSFGFPASGLSGVVQSRELEEPATCHRVAEDRFRRAVVKR